MAVTGTHLEVKVLVDKEKRRVLFIEADGDFVDVLFSFLTLPLGTIVRLIDKTRSEPAAVGCVSALYQSVMSLGNEHFFCDGLKDMLQHPRSCYEEQCRGLKINIDDTQPMYFHFVCPIRRCHGFMSLYRNAICPVHSYVMVNKVVPPDSSQGKAFVTKALKFIITDDLRVTPVLPMTVIGHLSNLGIKDTSVVEEQTVKLGINEVLELLKCIMLSTTPLTDLFVSKKKLPVTGSCVLKRSNCGEERKMNVKIVVNKSSKEFLYVEAGKEFIDFLFGFLVIPLGQVLHIMEGQSCLGCIDGLYRSAQSLDSQYFISQDQKDILLRPKLPLHNRYHSLLPLESAPVTFRELHCERKMPVDISFEGYESSGGFLRGKTVFIVADNLVVRPVSPASALSVLSRYKVSVSDLEEKIVTIGMAEGISILRASLNSTSAISNGLFLNNPILKEPKKEK